MSQEQRDKPTPDVPAPDVPSGNVNARREFIRQSLGVAPLMLTLGGRGNGGGASMHGTLWSSLGPLRRHKGDWWRFKTDKWRWTKGSGDRYREREETRPQRAHDKETPAPKDWDWNRSDDRWRRQLDADSNRKDTDWQRRESQSADRSYDWRKDDDYKRSEGLSPFASDRTNRKKD